MTSPTLHAVTKIESAFAQGSEWDAVVLVAPDVTDVPWPALAEAAKAAAVVDATVEDGVNLVLAPELAGARLILSPTGSLARDYDDVRSIADAAGKGLLRARAAGSKRPLLLISGVPKTDDFKHAVAVSLLNCTQRLWEPLEAREALGEKEIETVRAIGFGSDHDDDGDATAEFCAALEAGRRLARDLCGTEPERMAPPRFADYVKDAFHGTKVKVSIIDDKSTIEDDYPLLAAVARCSQDVKRHRPRVIRLEYEGKGPIEQTLLLAGKGVTYDTGGADLKTGGHMAGMSRDKGGAAAVAGFVRAVAELKPKNTRVVAEIGAVRNSVGANAYVSDEIIKSHAGARVRIGNTDAEGRLVLADLLSHLREEALDQKKSARTLIFSVATLTGHAAIAKGPYTASLDNGPAREAKVSKIFSHVGDLWGDPFDVSRLRREDFEFIKPRSKADDVLSCNNGPSVSTARGHQFPMAFLAIASGLDKHGQHDRRPLCFTHVDIAGSAIEGGDWQHGRPTGAPIVTLVRSLLE